MKFVLYTAWNHSMEARQFVDKLKMQIHSACRVVGDGQDGCRLWTGAKWGKSSYGMKTLRIPGNKKKLYFRVHRLVYALEYNKIPKLLCEITEDTLTPPCLDQNGVKLEVSHLCHESLCLNPDHLVLEQFRINLHRMVC